jgi:hypothetical protein
MDAAYYGMRSYEAWLPVEVVVEVVVQQVVCVSSGLVRRRGHGVALACGTPLQHSRGALRRPEPQHQRTVRIRPDAYSLPEQFALYATNNRMTFLLGSVAFLAYGY